MMIGRGNDEGMTQSKAPNLRLIIGGDRSNTFEIREGESLTIGRDPGCTIQINHQSISPIHCSLSYEGGILFVNDLESRAGIYFNNQKRKKLDLKEDVTFTLGEISITTLKTRSPLAFSLMPKSRTKVDFTPHAAAGEVVKRQPRKSMSPSNRERIRTALRRSPIFGLSLAAHLVVLIAIADLPYISRQTGKIKKIIAKVISPEDKYLLEEDDPISKKEFEEPEPLDEEILDLFESESVEMEEPLPLILPPPDEIAVLGLGSGGRSSRSWGVGTAVLNQGAHSKVFRKYIGNLRNTGMDVTFVIDSTSSMLPFIDEAKRIVDRLISKLAAVVPNLRLAMVTYRDEGDEYTTRHLDLTDDRYEILNFLEDCRAAGGGDFPEAIHDALHRAVYSLMWRERAKKVIILIGDAPFHEEECSQIDRLLREFSRGENGGVVNTIYVGPLSSPPSRNQKTSTDCFKHIALVAGGEFSWVSEQDKLIRHLVNMAFGSKWEVDVTRLLESVKKDRMGRLVERKAKTGQKAWLLEGLKKVPVRSGIVDTLVATAEPKDLEVLTGYLESDSIPNETKWAALYVLRKILKKPLSYNPYSNPAKQRKDILFIQRAVDDYNFNRK